MSNYFDYSQLTTLQEIEENRHNVEFLYRELLAAHHLCRNYHEIIELSTDGLFVADRNAVMLWINHAYETITGVSREQLLGKNAQIMADHYSFRAVCAVMCAKQKRPITLEQTLKDSGKKVLVSCQPLMDKAGEICIIIGTLRDISELDALKMTLSQAEESMNKYRAAYDLLKQQLKVFPNVIAADKKTVDTFHMAQRAAATDVPILLTGESGSGKEELAKFVHASSLRKDAPFVTINCGAIPPALMESELFGYERGAFTGANQKGKPGLLELASSGTVFLDEIGELPLGMQVKLLRVLQTQEVTRVGGLTPFHLDIRLVCATNRDLNQMVKDKLFRLDLLYRINTMTIQVPPLRDRPEDIPALVNAFLTEANTRFGFQKRISPLAFRVLYEYKWPGNIRELKNCIERALISTEDNTIVESDLQRILFPELQNTRPAGKRYSLKMELEKTEFKYMDGAYHTHQSVRKAAQMLGMSPSTFQRRYAELTRKYGGIGPEEPS